MCWWSLWSPWLLLPTLVPHICCPMASGLLQAGTAWMGLDGHGQHIWLQKEKGLGKGSTGAVSASLISALHSPSLVFPLLPLLIHSKRVNKSEQFAEAVCAGSSTPLTTGSGHSTFICRHFKLHMFAALHSGSTEKQQYFKNP